MTWSHSGPFSPPIIINYIHNLLGRFEGGGWSPRARLPKLHIEPFTQFEGSRTFTNFIEPLLPKKRTEQLWDWVSCIRHSRILVNFRSWYVGSNGVGLPQRHPPIVARSLPVGIGPDYLEPSSYHRCPNFKVWRPLECCAFTKVFKS